MTIESATPPTPAAAAPAAAAPNAAASGTPAADAGGTPPATPAAATPDAAAAAAAEAAKAAAPKGDPGLLISGKEGEGEKNADGTPKVKDGEAADPSQVQYADFALPDNYEIPEALKTEFTDFARSTGMNQEQAQKAIDMHVAQQQKQLDSWFDMQRDWQNTVKADPDMGGNNLNATLTNVNSVVKRFGAGFDTEVAEALKLTGAGNHPAIVRLFNNIGKGLKGDFLSGGPGGGSEAKLPPEKVLYPNMN